MTKKTLFTLLCFSVLSATVLSGAFLDFFQGRSDGNNITLEWKTRTETGVSSYEVQRKPGNSGEFITIGTLEPKGSNSYYSFVDRNAYKESANIYVYRLKIVEANGPASYSNEVPVSHGVSSVKRTWGSIKAMFR